MLRSRSLWIEICIAIIIIAALWHFHRTTLAAVGNLDIYDGSATVKRGQEEITGQTGIEVDMNDQITVSPNGSASIIFKDGSIMRLGPGSVFSLSRIAYHGGKISAAVMDLSAGKVWTNVQPIDPGGTMIIETPTIVATVRGTAFDVSYIGGTSELYVNNHAVWAALRENSGSVKEVSAGNVLAVRDAHAKADFAKGPKRSTPKDDWTIFNEKKDAGVQSKVSLARATKGRIARAVPKATIPANAPDDFSILSSIVPPDGAIEAIIPATLSLAANRPLSDVLEGDVLNFEATATLGNGIKKVVTNLAVWRVGGLTGTISSRGRFVAKLDSSMAEYGYALGTVSASWMDPANGMPILGKTPFFAVRKGVVLSKPIVKIKTRRRANVSIS